MRRLCKTTSCTSSFLSRVRYRFNFYPHRSDPIAPATGRIHSLNRPHWWRWALQARKSDTPNESTYFTPRAVHTLIMPTPQLAHVKLTRAVFLLARFSFAFSFFDPPAWLTEPSGWAPARMLAVLGAAWPTWTTEGSQSLSGTSRRARVVAASEVTIRPLLYTGPVALHTIRPLLYTGPVALHTIRTGTPTIAMRIRTLRRKGVSSRASKANGLSIQGGYGRAAPKSGAGKQATAEAGSGKYGLVEVLLLKDCTMDTAGFVVPMSLSHFKNAMERNGVGRIARPREVHPVTFRCGSSVGPG